jgi:preprotein translocase subunit SecG
MVILLIVVHTLVSLGLVAAVLLHSGKGTGLSSSFGGGAPSTFGGTGAIEKNLDRITIVLALIFIFTSVSLVLSI